MISKIGTLRPYFYAIRREAAAYFGRLHRLRHRKAQCVERQRIVILAMFLTWTRGPLGHKLGVARLPEGDAQGQRNQHRSRGKQR